MYNTFFSRQNYGQLDQKPWDPFREFTHDTDLYTFDACYDVTKKVLKVVFMVIMFLLVLLCLVTSKMCLLFITSNMNSFVAFKKYTIPKYHAKDGVKYAQCGVPVCFNGDYKSRDVVRWVWALYLCISTPYFLTFVQYTWKIIFKKKGNPEVKTVILVSISSLTVFLL